jgi:hypothetical protein
MDFFTLVIGFVAALLLLLKPLLFASPKKLKVDFQRPAYN